MFVRSIVVALLAASWAVMIVLARRPPPLIDAWPAERRILHRLAPATASLRPYDGAR